MVADLPPPARPLAGGRAWTWRWRAGTPQNPWGWCRIYHRDKHTPDAVTHRRYGPLHRLDHHTPPDTSPTACPDGRSILYVAKNLTTALGEVFGDYSEAQVCPQFRVAIVRPRAPVAVLDLRGQGAAMRVGALPSLATGAFSRQRTQEWARAIYEDQPVRGRRVNGIYYNAAHSNGPSLALWNTDDDVEVVTHKGLSQDFALAEASHVAPNSRQVGRTRPQGVIGDALREVSLAPTQFSRGG